MESRTSQAAGIVVAASGPALRILHEAVLDPPVGRDDAVPPARGCLPRGLEDGAIHVEGGLGPVEGGLRIGGSSPFARSAPWPTTDPGAPAVDIVYQPCAGVPVCQVGALAYKRTGSARRRLPYFQTRMEKLPEKDRAAIPGAGGIF